MSMFNMLEIRAIAADRPPGAEGDETLDELLDVIAADFAEMWPLAPEGAGWAFAVAQVSMAMQLGAPPDDDDGGGCGGPRKPAPEPAPEALLA